MGLTRHWVSVSPSVKRGQYYHSALPIECGKGGQAGQKSLPGQARALPSTAAAGFPSTLGRSGSCLWGAWLSHLRLQGQGQPREPVTCVRQCCASLPRPPSPGCPSPRAPWALTASRFGPSQGPPSSREASWRGKISFKTLRSKTLVVEFRVPLVRSFWRNALFSGSAAGFSSGSGSASPSLRPRG